MEARIEECAQTSCTLSRGLSIRLLECSLSYNPIVNTSTGAPHCVGASCPSGGATGAVVGDRTSAGVMTCCRVDGTADRRLMGADAERVFSQCGIVIAAGKDNTVAAAGTAGMAGRPIPWSSVGFAGLRGGPGNPTDS